MGDELDKASALAKKLIQNVNATGYLPSVPWKDMPEESLEPSSLLCHKHYSTRPYIHRVYPGCNSRACQFAHNNSEWRTPRQYKPLRPGWAQGVSESLTTRDWGSSHDADPHFSLEETAFYPTKYTRWLQSQSYYPNHRTPMLCQKFLYHGKCPFWQNCLFVHASTVSVREKAKEYFCTINGKPDACPARSVCPYAHLSSELVAPAYFTTSSTTSDRKTTVKIENDEFTVALNGIASNRYVSDKVCSYDFCDDFSCEETHLLPFQWEELVRQHPELKHHVPAYFHKLLRTASTAPSASPNSSPWGSKHSAPSSDTAPSATASDEFPSLRPSNSWTTSASDDTSKAMDGDSQQSNQLDFKVLFRVEPPRTVEFEASGRASHKYDRARRLAALLGEPLSSRWKDCYFQWMKSEEVAPDSQAEQFVFHRSLLIGKGADARVYLGLSIADGREIAVKVYGHPIDTSAEKEERLKQASREREALKVHGTIPGVVQYLGCWTATVETHCGELEYQYLVEDLMEASLEDVVNKWKGASDIFGSDAHLLACRFIAGSLLSTLEQLNNYSQHDPSSLAHMDVKPANVMFDRRLDVKLGDFGISSPFKGDSTSVTAVGVSAFYIAPELQAGDGRTYRTTDLYLLGLVMVNMLSGMHNWSVPADLGRVHQWIPGQWPRHRQETCVHLLQNLLIDSHNTRAFYSQAKKTSLTAHSLIRAHPFFWTARKALFFLVSLGGFKVAVVPGISDVVASAYEGDSWLPYVRDINSAVASTEHNIDNNDRRARDPIQLLVFIRNTVVHNKPSDFTNPDVSAMLQKSPVFIERFPRLVSSLWELLVKNLAYVLESPLLRSFVTDAYHASDLVLPDASQWL